MASDNYLSKDILNENTGISCGVWHANDTLVIDTMAFAGRLTLRGYADAQMLADGKRSIDVKIAKLTDLHLLPAFAAIFGEIVALMAADEEQPLHGATLDTSTVGQCLILDITDPLDGVTRTVWQTNGNFVINLGTQRAHLQVRGYPSKAVMEAGGKSTKTINFRIEDVFALTNFQDVYDQIVDIIKSDTEGEFDGAVLTPIPEPTPEA